MQLFVVFLPSANLPESPQASSVGKLWGPGVWCSHMGTGDPGALCWFIQRPTIASGQSQAPCPVCSMSLQPFSSLPFDFPFTGFGLRCSFFSGWSASLSVFSLGRGPLAPWRTWQIWLESPACGRPEPHPWFLRIPGASVVRVPPSWASAASRQTLLDSVWVWHERLLCWLTHTHTHTHTHNHSLWACVLLAVFPKTGQRWGRAHS